MRDAVTWVRAAWVLPILFPGAVLSARAQGTLRYTVTFDGAPQIPRGSARWVTSYAEQGVRFRPIIDDPTTSGFTTAGIIDGTGPLTDFETFQFDARFNDLVRLEVPTYQWALDNLVFAPVPEPGVWAFCGLGALLIASAMPGRKKPAGRDTDRQT